MAVNKKIILCFSWFVALTTTVKGNYKSCGEIQEAKENVSTPYIITIGNKNVEVSCNLTAQPAITVIKVDKVVEVSNPGAHGGDLSYRHDINYGNLTPADIRAFIEKSESCKQYVSYKCSNATLFGTKESPVSGWSSIEKTPKYYWAGCSFSGKDCQCDLGKSMPEEDAGYLAKKQDLPVTSLQIGGLSSDSNVSVTIGNIVCYGDSQKSAFTFGDKNAFVSLNVSSIKELKLKFKSSKYHKNSIIASIQSSKTNNIMIGLNSALKLYAGSLTFHKLDEEWHSIVITVDGKLASAVLDNGEKKVITTKSDIAVEKLILGSRKRECDSFVGCIKDLTVDGDDYSKMITETKMKEFIKDGCSAPTVQCSVPKVKSTTVDPTEPKPTVGTDPPVGPSDKNKKNNTNVNDDGDDDDGGNDDAVIIAIVVVFLILFIILVVIFFITWYLKRNKGVYQTHEGSAENIHGDTDNLTLVTKPCDEDPDGEKGKEYYL